MRRTETKSTVLWKRHLKALRLPTMTAECEKAARRCAAEDVDHLGFLLQLCEPELIERERRAAQRRLRAAPLPTVKTLEGFDLGAGKGFGRLGGQSRGAKSLKDIFTRIWAVPWIRGIVRTISRTTGLSISWNR
jgi:DNA replication protein DnaC